MYPKDTNGTAMNIFGGTLMSHMNSAGILECKRILKDRVVTVAFDSIIFKQPVRFDDDLFCMTEVTAIGETSVHVDILVEAQRAGKRFPVTQGKAVFVTVDAEGKKTTALGWNGKRPRMRKSTPPAEGRASASPIPIIGSNKSPVGAPAFKHSRKCPNIVVPMHTKDAGQTWVDISAGIIMGYMDSAAAITCRKICKNRIVTVAFDSIVFKQPVKVNDILYAWAEVSEIGTTSLKVDIIVEVLRDGQQLPVTTGKAVFVAVDENGNKTPVIGWNNKRLRRRKQRRCCDRCNQV